MFKITCDDFIISETGNPSLISYDVSLSRELNFAGELKFSIAKTHPYYNFIGADKIIRCYVDNELKFTGEITKGTPNEITGNIDFVAMGVLYKFAQTVQLYAENHNYTLLEFLTEIITTHNSQIGEKWQINIGNITVTDSNDNLYRGLSYETTQDVLKSKLREQLGGYFQIRESDGEFYLDYLADYTNMNSQGIVFGQNILTASSVKAFGDVYNSIFLVGAKIGDTEERITVASVNDGSIFVKDEESISAFGHRVFTETYNDITQPSNLLSKAYEVLQEHKYLKQSFTFGAIDLSKINVNYRAFKIGDYVKVKIPHNNIDTIAQISGIDDILTNEKRSKIYVGSKASTLTNSSVKVDKQLETVIKDYVTNDILKDTSNSLDYKIEQNSSAITQTANAIRSEVATTYLSNGEFESYKATSIEQTDEKIEFQFNQLKDVTDSTNDALQAEIAERQKYIKFEDGTIELGEKNNNFQTIIDNEAMKFKENGETVAHISNKTLHITDADVDGNLDIGGFRWIQRSNGNMSLVKI